ncbi:hypothetical protein RRG08_007751 [Elysia crispata]|uniref:Uncharacterized protein n=1 Tax=Elysia crispata TaxID=231223 RepID=A0AAE1DTT0_9GAST|nr:hypothetical protein RRG08_007751 [Elysia crispata]
MRGEWVSRAGHMLPSSASPSRHSKHRSERPARLLWGETSVSNHHHKLARFGRCSVDKESFASTIWNTADPLTFWDDENADRRTYGKRSMTETLRSLMSLTSYKLSGNPYPGMALRQTEDEGARYLVSKELDDCIHGCSKFGFRHEKPKLLSLTKTCKNDVWCQGLINILLRRETRGVCYSSKSAITLYCLTGVKKPESLCVGLQVLCDSAITLYCLTGAEKPESLCVGLHLLCDSAIAPHCLTVAKEPRVLVRGRNEIYADIATIFGRESARFQPVCACRGRQAWMTSWHLTADSMNKFSYTSPTQGPVSDVRTNIPSFGLARYSIRRFSRGHTVMENVYGKWKVAVDRTTGVAEIGKLFGWTEEKQKMFSSLEYTMLLEASGDKHR